MNRREFIYGVNGGLGALAFHSMLRAEETQGPLAPKVAHFSKAKAKRCIFLFMAGGPSHIERPTWSSTACAESGWKNTESSPRSRSPLRPRRPTGTRRASSRRALLRWHAGAAGAGAAGPAGAVAAMAAGA